MINLAVGILPHVDNFAHIGGFLSGFLLGFILLIRPQFGWLESRHRPDQARLESKYSMYQYVLLIAATVLWIVGYAFYFYLNRTFELLQDSEVLHVRKTHINGNLVVRYRRHFFLRRLFLSKVVMYVANI